MKIECYGKSIRVSKFAIFVFVVATIKLILMGVFSSDYQNDMFMRFIEGYVEQFRLGNGINPYDYFSNEVGLFPYPPMMLVIESISGFFLTFISDNLVIRNIIFKLPTFIFDIVGMMYLIKMFPTKKKYIGIFYYMSPIIIYAAYMHGQLDIIPTTFLIMTIYYLTTPLKEYKLFDWKVILALTAALCCKFHIVAVVPILFAFLAKRDGWKKAILTFSIVFILLGVSILPFWCPGFVNNVLFNEEQSILTKITFDYGSIQIYLPILTVLFIYLNVFTISRMNKDLLYSVCGVLFAVFLVLIPPMPGWYIWVVPFITILFIDIRSDRYLNILVYILLNCAYLVYFLVVHQTAFTDLYYFTSSLDSIKLQSEFIRNLSFTILVAIMLYATYMMYHAGIASNSLYKRRSMPFIIGVAGDSGSGKSTLIHTVEMIFGKRNLLFIEGDGDHKWERGNTMWDHYTHLNPKSNYLYRQARDLEILRMGHSVMRVDYDHDTGKFTKKKKIRPKQYILLSGLHALYLPQIRRSLDMKIYMDIDESLRRFWKIQRDTQKRGYSRADIIEQIEGRISDAKKYIYPQKKYADLIITYFDENLKSDAPDDYKVNLSLKVTISIEINAEELISQIKEYGIDVYYDYDNDLEKQIITFKDKNLESLTLPIDRIAKNVVPRLDEILNHPLNATDNLHGIIEIIILLVMAKKLEGERIND